MRIRIDAWCMLLWGSACVLWSLHGWKSTHHQGPRALPATPDEHPVTHTQLGRAGMGLIPKRTTLYVLVNRSARRSLGVDGVDFYLEGQMIWKPSMS